MKKLVSIIIPLYNNEQYISDCLQSIVEQTYKNIEIIVVDDGSSDSSYNVACEYQEKHNCIKVVKKSNGGVSSARKRGFQESKGDYIMFVDSDDKLLPELVEKLIEREADIVCSNITHIKNNTNWIQRNGVGEGEYSTEEEMNYIKDNMIYLKGTDEFGILGYLPGKLFKREIVKKVFNNYNTNIYIAEDEAFVYSAILQCKSLQIIDDSLYCYIHRCYSAMEKKDYKILNNFSEYYEYLYNIFSEEKEHQLLIKQLEKHMMFWLNTVLINKMGFMYYKDRRYSVNDIEDFIGKRIVIYGTGNVGKGYMYHLGKIDCTIVDMIDRKGNAALGIKEMKEVTHMEYDIIVIAVLNENDAKKIKNDLLALGVKEERIYWSKPQDLIWKMDYSD